YVDALLEGVNAEFERQQVVDYRKTVDVDARVSVLRNQIRITVDKIKMISSESAIKYLEEDITKYEEEIADLEIQKHETVTQEPTSIAKINAYTRYYLEHMEDIILNIGNPLLQAKFFGVI